MQGDAAAASYLRSLLGSTGNIAVSMAGIVKFSELKAKLASHELEEVKGLASGPIWDKMVDALKAAGYEDNDFKPFLSDLGTMGPEKLSASMKCEPARAQASLRRLCNICSPAGDAGVTQSSGAMPPARGVGLLSCDAFTGHFSEADRIPGGWSACGQPCDAIHAIFRK